LRIYEQTKNLIPKQRTELTCQTVRKFEKEGDIQFNRLKAVFYCKTFYTKKYCDGHTII